MTEIIKTAEIADLNERPALLRFVEAVNANDTSAPDFGMDDLISSIIAGAIRAINALEERVIELERR